MRHLFFLLIFFNVGFVNAQKNIIGSYYAQNEHSVIKEYIDFLSIPNTFTEPTQLNLNADFILNMMKKSGINGQLLYDKDKKSIPAVYGEYKQPGATKTIIFYAHYDGMPVNKAEWYDGLDPFKPQLASNRIDKGGKFIDFPKNGESFDPLWRIYARSAADDKAGVFCILKAFEAIKSQGLTPGVNLKFFFEGEEESGSINLENILEHNKHLLQGDLWIVCDGPMPVSGQPQISYGVRGDINVHLTVYGPKRPLHSGNYGNWAPNPAHKLVRLLASMKDDDGKVLVKDYYKDVVPLSKSERQALMDMGDQGPQLQDELGFAQSETKGLSYMESIMTLPTLNINGISSANVGDKANNVIPSIAQAVLDLRLVKGNTIENQLDRIKNHIKKQGFYITTSDPTDAERKKHKNIIKITHEKGYIAQRTPMDLPIAKKVAQSIQEISDKKLILKPSSGGSLPLYLFEKVTKTPPITISVVNYDNNQHAENENVELGRIAKGIERLAAVMLFTNY